MSGNGGQAPVVQCQPSKEGEQISVEAGEELGRVVDPTTGEVRETVPSPVSGRALAIRELPVVFPGTVVARVVSA